MAYEYGAKEPEKLKIKDMTPKQKELLIESDSFCMLPWMQKLSDSINNSFCLGVMSY